jgi:hypothetical protein
MVKQPKRLGPVFGRWAADGHIAASSLHILKIFCPVLGAMYERITEGLDTAGLRDVLQRFSDFCTPPFGMQKKVHMVSFHFLSLLIKPCLNASAGCDAEEFADHSGLDDWQPISRAEGISCRHGWFSHMIINFLFQPDNVSPFPDLRRGIFLPGCTKQRLLRRYAKGVQQDTQRDGACRKRGARHQYLLPGTMMLLCPHGICLGYDDCFRSYRYVIFDELFSTSSWCCLI